MFHPARQKTVEFFVRNIFGARIIFSSRTFTGLIDYVPHRVIGDVSHVTDDEISQELLGLGSFCLI